MSLRARLLVGLALVAVVLAGVAVAVTRATESHLVNQVDAQLQAAGPPRVFDGFGDEGFPDGGRGPDRRFERPSDLYQGVVDGQGTLHTLSTPNLSQTSLPLPELSVEKCQEAAADREPFTVTADGSDVRYRVLAQSGPASTVVVSALPLNDVDDAVDRLVQVEVVATVLVLAILALVTSWVLRLGVRPIKQMTATATAIAGGDLSHRVPDVASGTEAGELGLALNRMLGTIEEAFDERTRSEGRLRQFVADASHELRTPVTTIRGYAELYRSGGLDERGELDEAMRRTEQEAVRMGSLVDDLLELARLDQGRPLAREAVDLDALARDAVRDAGAVDPDRPVSLASAGPLLVQGDEARLRQIVGNLVGNARVHTPPDAAIELRVHRDGDRAVLEVRDEGPGMDPEVAARAFERFYRADPSRSRHRGGSGLGLSIVQATVAAHDGTVSIDTAPGQGTTIRVELPVAPASDAAPVDDAGAGEPSDGPPTDSA